jgi:hypothetical protein
VWSFPKNLQQKFRKKGPRELVQTQDKTQCRWLWGLDWY